MLATQEVVDSSYQEKSGIETSHIFAKLHQVVALPRGHTFTASAFNRHAEVVICGLFSHFMVLNEFLFPVQKADRLFFCPQLEDTVEQVQGVKAHMEDQIDHLIVAESVVDQVHHVLHWFLDVVVVDEVCQHLDVNVVFMHVLVNLSWYHTLNAVRQRLLLTRLHEYKHG